MCCSRFFQLGVIECCGHRGFNGDVVEKGEEVEKYCAWSGMGISSSLEGPRQSLELKVNFNRF